MVQSCSPVLSQEIRAYFSVPFTNAPPPALGRRWHRTPERSSPGLRFLIFSGMVLTVLAYHINEVLSIGPGSHQGVCDCVVSSGGPAHLGWHLGLPHSTGSSRSSYEGEASPFTWLPTVSMAFSCPGSQVARWCLFILLASHLYRPFLSYVVRDHQLSEAVSLDLFHTLGHMDRAD